MNSIFYYCNMCYKSRFANHMLITFSMSLSELFGDLVDDDEEDYRPDAADISDIGSDDNDVDKQQSFSLENELLKPMKPPEFDSDNEISNKPKKLTTIDDSDDDDDEPTNLGQLNKNLFGRGISSEQDQELPDSSFKKEDFFKDSDDDDDFDVTKTKTTTADLFGSDVDDTDEGEGKDETNNATQQDIFGSDVSLSDASEGAPDADGATKRSDGESEEEDESELTVDMPLVDIKLGENLHQARLPNFISVDTRPFDPETYEDEIEDDNEVTDEEGRARLKLRVENTIRWRHALDERGNLIKQSNARVIKWSDGSLSMFIGAEEFDIMQAPITHSNSHLYVKHGAGIQGQAQFHNKMLFKIHSTNSNTHRKMTLRISDRVSKDSATKTLPAVGRNPEEKREEICKREEERLQAQRRRENMQKKMREKNLHKTLNARYLEPDQDDETSLSSIKNSYKQRAKMKKPAPKKVSDVYSSEEEDIPEETLVASDSEGSSPIKKKRSAVIDDESDG